MQDKDQQRMDARMKNFKLKPSENVWIGIEKELRKNKRRPLAWWWTSLLLLPLVLFVIYLQVNPEKKSSTDAVAKKESRAVKEKMDNAEASLISEEKQPHINPIKPAAQSSGNLQKHHAPLMEGNKDAGLLKSVPATTQREEVDAIPRLKAAKPIAYRDLKNSLKVDIENHEAVLAAEEKILARNGIPYKRLEQSETGIQNISIVPFSSGETALLYPGMEVIKAYKDEKSGGILSPKKQATTIPKKWKLNLHTSAFVMNQGSFLDGFDLNKNLRDAYSAPSTSPGQSFTQKQTVLNNAKRLGIGAIGHYGATRRISFNGGIELQRRLYDITQSTFFGAMPNSGNYSSVVTSRSEIKDNQWAVEIPIGIGLQFGKRFNLALQLNNAYVFEGIDSLRIFATNNNLSGYQPAIGITPQLILGKNSNWSIGLPLETGLNKSTYGQFNNAVGLRLSYFP